MKNRHAYMLCGVGFWAMAVFLHATVVAGVYEFMGGLLFGAGLFKCWTEGDE